MNRPQNLLVRAGLRHLARHPWQPALSIVGVSLGVAMVVGVDLANQSARRAFSASMDAVTGRATHEIVGGPFGFPEGVYRKLRLEAGVRPSAPVVEGDAALESGGTVHILGVDGFAEAPFRSLSGLALGSDLERLVAEPGAVLAGEETSRRLGLELGGSLPILVSGVERKVVLVGRIRPDGGLDRLALENLLVADLATAQELLGYGGRLTRIDLLAPEGEAGEAYLARALAALPPSLELQPAGGRTSAQASLTRGFELNLTALSFLALLVGMFLIYNTMTFAVVQRREALGVLRGLGVTGTEVYAAVLAEALVIGLVGTASGLALGTALGRGLVGMVTRTINDFYFVLSARSMTLEPLSYAKGVALGLGATLVSAAIPAREAALVPPRIMWLRSAAEDRMRRLAPLWAVGGAVLLWGALAAALVPSRSVHLGLLALLLLTVGSAMWVPAVMLIVDPILRRLSALCAGFLGKLAVGGVTASMSRTVPAIAALMVSVAVVIGMGSMIRSFRRTVAGWLETHLPADIYVAPPSLVSGRPSTTMEPEVVEAFRRAPGVRETIRFRNLRIEPETAEGPNAPFWLVAAENHPSLRRAFPLKETPAAQAAPGRASAERPGGLSGAAEHLFTKEGGLDDAWSGWERGDLLVSEPLALRLGLRAGSTLALRTDRGPTPFRVAGVFFDYASDQGAAILRRDSFERLWDDRGVSSMAVFVEPGAGTGRVVAALRERAEGRQQVLVRSTRELKDASLEVFDRTFAITSVMRLLAMIVSFIGVLSALMALQLEKERELAVLRANGLTPGQLWALVTAQTGLMGLTAGVLALPLGWATTALLIHVINKRSFNWSIEMFLDPSAVAQGLFLAVAAAVLAGLYPAWKMARTSPARALRAEA